MPSCGLKEKLYKYIYIYILGAIPSEAYNADQRYMSSHTNTDVISHNHSIIYILYI